jgi:hypothetical protein
MNRQLFSFQTLLLLALVVCLLAALVPVVDFDSDGLSDSFLTEGLLLLPEQVLAYGLVCLLTYLPVAYLATPRPYIFLIVPPPDIF